MREKTPLASESPPPSHQLRDVTLVGRLCACYRNILTPRRDEGRILGGAQVLASCEHAESRGGGGRHATKEEEESVVQHDDDDLGCTRKRELAREDLEARPHPLEASEAWGKAPSTRALENTLTGNCIPAPAGATRSPFQRG